MRYMRTQHIRRASDFARIRTTGLRRDCGFFYGWILPEGQSTGSRPRMAAVASRRLGPAVERNRAKRRLRSLFRLHQQRLPAGCDLMLMARRSLLRASFSELEACFLRAFAMPPASANSNPDDARR